MNSFERTTCALLGCGLLLAVACAGPAAETSRLTVDGRWKRDIVVTPHSNGNELLYVVQESQILLALMKLNLATGASERFRPDAAANEFEPTFSADGKRLAFVQSRGNLSLRLVIRDTAGNEEAAFDPGGGFAGVHAPCFSPDGAAVAFALPAGARQEIVTVDAKGGNLKKLTDRPGIHNWPRYSPDGKRLAFASSRDGDLELYVMNADGGQPLRLTHSPGRDMRPAWSPDGKRIAFVSTRDGNCELYVVNADGTQPRNISQHPEDDDYPVWHPSGKQLFFIGQRRGKYDVHRIDVPE